MDSASIENKVVVYSALYFLVTQNKRTTIARLKEDTLLGRLGVHLPTNMAIGSALGRSRMFVKAKLAKSHSSPDAAAEYCLAPRVYGNLLNHRAIIIRRTDKPLRLCELILKYAGTL